MADGGVAPLTGRENRALSIKAALLYTGMCISLSIGHSAFGQRNLHSILSTRERRTIELKRALAEKKTIIQLSAGWLLYG